MAGFTQGLRKSTRNPRAFENTQNVGTTFENIFTIRNRRTYNGYTNQVEIEPRLLTLAAEGTKNVEVEVRATSNPGVEQNFTTVGTNLVADVDTSSVEVTSGRLLVATVIAPGSTEVLNLRDLEIRLPPSLNLVVQARVTSGSATDVSAALTWYEDV